MGGKDGGQDKMTSVVKTNTQAGLTSHECDRLKLMAKLNTLCAEMHKSAQVGKWF